MTRFGKLFDRILQQSRRVRKANRFSNSSRALRGRFYSCETLEPRHLLAADFAAPVFFAATSGELLSADFNNDGAADLAIVQSGQFTVLQGDGSGGLGSPSTYPIGTTEGGALIADLNGDGFSDLVTARRATTPGGNSVISVLLNNGDGTFAGQAFEYAIIGPSASGGQLSPMAMTAADLDGDGDLDLAAATVELNTLGQPGFFSVILNEGLDTGGTPILATSVNIASGGSFARSIVATDVDNDGVVDLAIVNELDNSMSRLLNDGSGVSGKIRKAAIVGTISQPRQLIAGDVNGDGFVDLVAINAQHTFSVLLNLDGGTDPRKAGRFKDQGQSPLGDQGLPAANLPASATLADFDGDGVLDLAVALVGDSGPGSVVVLSGLGDGTFGPEVAFAVGPDHTSIIATDLDNDGDLEIISANGSAQTITVLRNLNLNLTNVAPVAVNDSAYQVNEDTTLNVSAATGVLANDTDIDGDALSATLLSGPASGAVTLNSDGSFSYTPSVNFNGTDSFTYLANDGSLNSAPATVTIAVAAVNDAPVAIDDAYNIDQNGNVTILATNGVLANDTDIEGNSLAAVLVAGPSSGAVVLNADGSFTYTAGPNFSGNDSFTYFANDGTDSGNVSTVWLGVVANGDFQLGAFTGWSFFTTPNGRIDPQFPSPLALPTPRVDLFDTNGDGADSLAGLFQVGSQSVVNGFINWEGGGILQTISTKAGDLTIDVDIAASGVGNSSGGLFQLRLDGFTIASHNFGQIGFTAAGIPGIKRATLTATRPVLEGTHELSIRMARPFLNIGGSTPIQYVDNVAVSGSAVFGPVSFDDAYTVNEDTTLTVSALTGVLANDNTAAAVVAVNGPASGSVTLAGDGSFTYTPNADFNGIDSFTYQAGGGNVATVVLTVNPINDAPVAVNDAYSVNQDSTLIVLAGTGVLSNDTDIDGDLLTASLVTGPSHGTLSLGIGGAVFYTPTAGFSGIDSFTYQTSDPSGASSSATVALTVNAAAGGTKFFVIDAANKDTFEYDAAGNLVTNYNLAPGNSKPRGATSNADGSTVWILDRSGTVFIYDDAGVPQGSWSAGGGLKQADGIATDGSDIWIVDRKFDTVFRYSGAAALTSGSADPASSFALDGANKTPMGITTDGTSLWIVNDSGGGDSVFKYAVADGSLVGSWGIDPTNSIPTGITIDPNDVNNIWIVDAGTDTVFQYNAAAGRVSGNQLADATFSLALANTDPQGIADPLPRIDSAVDQSSADATITTLGSPTTPSFFQDHNALKLDPSVESHLSSQRAPDKTAQLRDFSLDGLLVDATLAAGEANRPLGADLMPTRKISFGRDEDALLEESVSDFSSELDAIFQAVGEGMLDDLQ